MRIPAVSTRSLIAIGIPCSGPCKRTCVIGGGSFSEGALRHERDDCVHPWVHRVDPLEEVRDDLDGRHLTSCNQCLQLDCG